MSVDPGSLSPDGEWIWNGSSWMPSRSADGRWRWTGHAWVPAATSPRSRLAWERSWRRKDTIRLSEWLIVSPLLLGGAVTLISVLASLAALTTALAAVGAYLLWAAIGGVLVRSDGRWIEAAVLAAILVVVVLAAFVGATLYPDVVGSGDPQADHAAGIGSVLIIAVTFPPTLAAVAAGKGMSRLVQRASGRHA